MFLLSDILILLSGIVIAFREIIIAFRETGKFISEIYPTFSEIPCFASGVVNVCPGITFY